MSGTTTAGDVLSLNPFVGQDFYVPAFRVLVNGKQLMEIEQDVISLSYTDRKNEIDHAELTVNNWNPDGKGSPGCWKYSDSDDLSPWQEIEIWMGYYRGGLDELRRMMVGELVRLTPNFSSDSPATLTVRAMGILNRLKTTQISRDYSQQKDSEIFQDIVNTVAKHIRQTLPNLTLATDSVEIQRSLAKEKPIKSLTIKQQYAINYLLKRANDINYELAVDVSQGAVGGPRTVTLHYRRPDISDNNIPTYSLAWGNALLSFQPSLATANQVSEVIVRSWNPLLKKKFEGKATLADLQNEGIVDPAADLKLTQGPLSKKTQIITDKVVQSDAEALEAAKSELRNLAQGIVLAKGRTFGLPDLRTGAMIQICGVGKRFSGNYVVEETTHTISDSGYMTDFTCRMQKQVPPTRIPSCQ